MLIMSLFPSHEDGISRAPAGLRSQVSETGRERDDKESAHYSEIKPGNCAMSTVTARFRGIFLSQKDSGGLRALAPKMLPADHTTNAEFLKRRSANM